jgi:hypothetical protein
MSDNSISYKKQSFEGDRKEKMIELLQHKSIVGVFLFFLYGKIGEQMPGFITPPGLTQEESDEFSQRFLELLGEYAQKAEKRKGNL